MLPAEKKTSAFIEKDFFSDELFESNDVLNIKLSGDLRSLFNDRSDNAKYHDISLSYTDKNSTVITIPVKAKTRGNFRRTMGNCVYPPIQLDFSENKNPQASLFKGQVKMKLVMPCRGDDLIVREYLLYKLYNLVTEKSFRARLVKIESEDTRKNKTTSYYGMLLEEDQQLAKRNHLKLIKNKTIKMQSTETESFLRMAMFEYLIGNTDWSVEYLQNIRLLAKDSVSIPTAVPYDFDHAGLVDAPYAQPAEALEMKSVRERRYRGYCVTDMKQFDKAIDFYNQIKTKIYSLYNDCTLIDAKYRKETLKYLDGFYATINNPGSVKDEFGYPCRPDGTGNIIIKGIEKN